MTAGPMATAATAGLSTGTGAVPVKWASVAAGLALVASSPALASSFYDLTVIADSRTLNGGRFTGAGLSLNDQGVVAWATVRNVQGRDVESTLRIGDGTSQQTILTNTSRQAAFSNGVSINNSGQVAYLFNPSGLSSVRIWDSGNTTVVIPGPQWASFYGGLSDNARFAQNRQSSGGLRIINPNGSSFGVGIGSMSTGNFPVISRNGELAALYGSASFGSQDLTLAVLDERFGGRFFAMGNRSSNNISGISINNHGQVAFVSQNPTGTPDLIGTINVRGASSQYSVVFRPGGNIGPDLGASPDGIAINNLNEIAFVADAHGGIRSLYRTDVGATAPVPVALAGEAVTVLGARIESISAGTVDAHSMNDRGQIAFMANMRNLDGSGALFEAILRADPIEGISPARPILPEPAPPAPGPPVWTMPIVRMPAGVVPGRRPLTNYDPDIAVGYDYRVSEGAPNFAAVQIPAPLANGDDRFELSFAGQSFTLHAGEVFDFTSVAAMGVSLFRISGIDADEALDPHSSTAFVTGIGFMEGGLDGATFTMTPIVVTVPEPSPFWMLLAGNATLFGVVRRRNGVRGSSR